MCFFSSALKIPCCTIYTGCNGWRIFNRPNYIFLRLSWPEEGGRARPLEFLINPAANAFPEKIAFQLKHGGFFPWWKGPPPPGYSSPRKNWTKAAPWALFSQGGLASTQKTVGRGRRRRGPNSSSYRVSLLNPGETLRVWSPKWNRRRCCLVNKFSCPSFRQLFCELFLMLLS